MNDFIAKLYFKEACNTLRASQWQLFKARLFGKKLTTNGPDGTVTMLRYKGAYYMIDYKPPTQRRSHG